MPSALHLRAQIEANRRIEPSGLPAPASFLSGCSYGDSRDRCPTAWWIACRAPSARLLDRNAPTHYACTRICRWHDPGGQACALGRRLRYPASRIRGSHGIDLSRLLWVRCGVSPAPRRKHWSRLEQGLRVTDLLLQAGGFSCIVMDMGSLKAEYASRVPLATWFRFRAAAERLAIERGCCC